MASSLLLHAVVGNIPVCYHSSDLRNFFSRFIEKDGFDCFHFRHRPENRNLKMEKTSESYSEGSRQKGNCTLPSTCCCVIRLSESQYKDLVDVYHYRQWITETGESMKSSCRIRRIKVDHKTQDKTTEAQYKTRSEQSFVSPDREEFNEEDLANLAELHPPTVMPKGNVGTPTLVFWDLIRQCLLPPKIIGKLKLKFPKMGFNKKYGNVPFDYEGSENFVLDEERIELSRLAVKSGTGHELQLEEGLIGCYDKNEDCLDRVRVRVEDIEGSADDWELFECGVMKGSNPRPDEGFRGKERKGERSVGGGVMKEGVYIGGRVREADRRLAGDERGGSEDQREVERGGVDGEGRREEELEREGKEREIKKKKKEESQGFGRRRKEETGNRESVERGEMTLGKGMNEKSREAEEIGSRISRSRPQDPEPRKENTRSLADGGIDEAARVQRMRKLEKKASKAKKRRETDARRRKMALRIEEKMIEFERGSDRSEEDADDCEEWERHEALHDDPSNQERNEERLFEQEIELKWEKGGSGLVFYTDAQFWKEQEGDFDEQTADDWDVDMSGYYDPSGGDMDGQDLIRIRRDTRRRDGLDDEDGQGIGKFERHTKGIGRKILERQGWKDGKGLGSSASGIAEALTNDGQNPHCKTGFGFQESKQRRKNKMFYRKQEIPTEWHRPIISTIYDDPSITDPMDPLLRRNEPYQLKRRKIENSS